MEISQLDGDLGDVLHTAAADGNLASVVCRGVQNLLDTIDVRGERRDNNTLITALELRLKRLSDLNLTRGVAVALDIGRVTHQCEHALLAQLTEPRQVDHLAGYRRRVDLEVAGVDDHAERRRDRQRYRVRNRVVCVDQLDVKASELDMIPGADTADIHLIGHAVLLELGVQNTGNQSRAVHRNLELLEHIRQCTDVVLMSVRDDNTANLVLVTAQVGNVRNDQVDAQHLIIRERQTAVDDKDVLSVLNHRHVLTDLIESAERYNFQFFLHKFEITFLCIRLSAVPLQMGVRLSASAAAELPVDCLNNSELRSFAAVPHSVSLVSIPQFCPIVHKNASVFKFTVLFTNHPVFFSLFCACSHTAHHIPIFFLGFPKLLCICSIDRIY